MKRLFCLLLAALCLLAGCDAGTRQEQLTVFCMDTVMDIRVTGRNCAGAAKDVASLLRELEKQWSASDPDSAVSQWNQVVFSPNEKQQAVLDKALALSERTGGALDLRLGALSESWGFRDDSHRIPTQEEITEALKQKKWDFGAVIKGFAGQEAADLLLKTPGVACAILNLGGNVQTVGTKENGQPWMIGIQDPFGGDSLGTIAVTGTASVVTSGDYQRYFEQDGIRYHHILDPKTGAPARSGLASVTVVCRDGMTADALSTALFVMGLEQGGAFWRESEDFEAVFVLSTGEIYATEGVSLSGCEYEVIRREK